MFLNAKTYWMYPPELSYRQLTGGEGLLRNASAARGGRPQVPLRMAFVAVTVFQRQGTDGGPAGQVGTTQPPSGLAG